MSSKYARIYIEGDAKGAQKATRDAEAAIKQLNQAGRRHFDSLRSSAAGFGVGLGAAGLVGVLGQSVRAFGESEKSGARLGAQLRQMGLDTDQVRKHIDNVVQSQSKMKAFDDEDLTDAFTRILRTAKDVDTALGPQGIGLAMDIARARGIDLSSAADMVAKAYLGQTTGLKRAGVEIQKGATAQEALAAAQKTFGGQAKEYGESSAAAADRAAIAWENAPRMPFRGLAFPRLSSADRVAPEDGTRFPSTS